MFIFNSFHFCSQGTNKAGYTPTFLYIPKSTLAKERWKSNKLVGLPGNAPGPHAPHACILLLYYSPFIFIQLKTNEDELKQSVSSWFSIEKFVHLQLIC